MEIKTKAFHLLAKNSHFSICI